MSFRDLPEGWQDKPLETDRLMADVLDLFVSNQARYDGALVFLLCDESRRLKAPVQVDDVDVSPGPDSELMLANLVTAIMQAGDGRLSALVGIARPGRLRIFPGDVAWADRIEHACRDRVPIMGIHLMTPRGSLRLKADPLVA